MNYKVLVGITIQENSRRLIAEGFNLSQSIDAPLHILHIRKGETIFDRPESSELLSDLFAYGGELGGEVHFLCSNNIPETITSFIKENDITHLVIGETPNGNTISPGSSVYEQLKSQIGDIEIVVLPREIIEDKMA
ncbi:hypothetical protein QTL86_21185 [Cellulosilyticum sp. ST5]|uniref:UspA domain-containing protein n=1 Tax=Cellulosilyticum lentocellum (strain ATCC 49066 / DSM 5427 / NCIMB 11756 / RHM5) TaxID=642492 RepID=F2JH23_CELLD|nr:UspA domain-containing protein [Cellulosilyticum lentocellum]ADZ85363.1 UspA domain-containing protein [Cellulosilyticum lentocellum DSM 5427]